MKVNNLHLEKMRKNYLQQKNNTGKETKKVRQDSMDISQKALEMKDIRAKMAELPEVREEKIAKLKEAVQKGNYQIDNKLLARKILADDLEQE